MPGDLLEENLREPYLNWKKNPGPEANAQILNTLHPTIEGAIKTHVGQSNPLLYSRARLMALEGLKNYDPARGRLQSHLYNHLQGLKRVNRQQTTILKVPERVALDRYHLENAHQELTHALGREPTDEEIANHTGVSLKRIAKVRNYSPAVAEGTLQEAMLGEGPVGGVSLPGAPSHPMHVDMVYDELDDYHKKVMEHALGLHGRRPLSNQSIARKMNRSPGAISQAKLRIQKMLDEAQELTQTAM